MYKNFKLPNVEGITGYEWDAPKPKAVVCLVHGIGEHAGRYDRVAKVFNDNEIAFVSMDLRGHGLSKGVRGHVGRRSDVLIDVDRLIEYTISKYQAPLILYGHSLGGNIVLDYRYTGTYSGKPVGYVVTSPWIELVRPIPKALYGIVKLGAKIKPDLKISQNIESSMLGDTKLIEKESGRELVHGNITLLTAVDGFERGKRILEGTLEDVHGGGEKPMLLMHGSEDPICSVKASRKYADLNKTVCKYIEWPGFLHELHNGTDDKDSLPVINAMVDWVKETAF